MRVVIIIVCATGVILVVTACMAIKTVSCAPSKGQLTKRVKILSN